MNSPTIIIKTPDSSLRRDLRRLVSDQGYEVIESSDLGELIRSLQNDNPDLIIIGSSQKGATDGLEAVRESRRFEPDTPIILITRGGSEEMAIEALRSGASDYLRMPLESEDLIASLKRNLPAPGPTSITTPEPITLNHVGGNKLVTRSPAMGGMIKFLKKAAVTDCNVFITGETGTGKELVANLLHQYSPRAKNPIVIINCAAIPDTLLESELFGYEKGAFTGAFARKEGALRMADSGTIFFDEIGDMSLQAQAKVLRIMETKEVCRVGGTQTVPFNVRFVAATNKDPEQLMKEDKFRSDLYFRFNVARIYLPPLRERQEDIVLLLEYFRRKLNRQFGKKVKGFTPETVKVLMDYSWPGNIRELKNRLEAAFIGAGQHISLDNFPAFFRNQLQEDQDLSQDERSRLVTALFQSKWNKTKAAQQLQWSRMTLYRKMEKYRVLSPNGEEAQQNFPSLETDYRLN
jgi:DNA-binding NtrC family response regulator